MSAAVDDGSDPINLIRTTPHEYAANYHYTDYGVKPYFALDNAVKAVGGSTTEAFSLNGERWTSKLYYQDGNLLPPEDGRTPGGARFELENIREFRIQVQRHSEEDSAGQQSFNVHFAPRWPNLKAETKNGGTTDIPAQFEGLNAKVNGSNIEFERYPRLIQAAAEAVDVNGKYFAPDSYADSSNIRDIARYVRLHKNASGPVHARDGPITKLSHLLESDRDGYRKLVQNDANERGDQLPGYYHTATVDVGRIQDAWPTHQLPKEIKHYYAREALSFPTDHPLRHPKVEAAYQVSRSDGTLYVDDLERANRELEETVHSVLADAGIDVNPIGGPGSFVEDAYFDAETHKAPAPTRLNLVQIENSQESIVTRHVADGLSPVQWSSLEVLVTDGGEVAPADIAEIKGHHVDSVRRALRDMENLVDRKYGEVALQSEHIAKMVYEAVEEATDSLQNAVETGARAIEMADRQVQQGKAEFVAWCSRHGVDLSNRTGALEIDLGTHDKDKDGPLKRRVKKAFKMWTNSGHDPIRFKQGQITVTTNGKQKSLNALRWV